MSGGDGHDPYDYESLFQGNDGPDPSWRDRFSKRTVVVAGIILGVLILVIGSLTFVNSQINPRGTSGEVTVEVPKGASFSNVATLLAEKKVVKSAFFLRLYAKVKGAPNVQAGQYAFNFNSHASDVISILKDGPKEKTDRLTIPEGLRIDQIAQRVGAVEGLSATKFYQLATSGVVHSDYQPSGSNNLEGLLFPDTYLLSAADTEQVLLQRMVNEFDNQAKLAGMDNSESSIGHTPYETVIIASMIESEAKVPQDRGKISQVIENRLFKAQKLQIDATVLYALGNKKNVLSYKDLEYPSEYNTYQNLGLPPAPISAPGAASIKAALQPTPGPWLFYVVTGADGSHSFATTLDQQNANIKLAEQRGLR